MFPGLMEKLVINDKHSPLITNFFVMSDQLIDRSISIKSSANTELFSILLTWNIEFINN
ncbi:MAG: hypothetical protein ACD_3C00160G0005 [uncultured bacterium (gcode 4)]|uniref:Uncharacterized protein n=1 Tax=uncultured bacterium (gcode 4) TaxID=1234023 RepID=K2F9F8_9BACT|nr:MAG: hypothetical protein ACD_3C00160G0005 [uncultured bacterium (gcode 4)]